MEKIVPFGVFVTANADFGADGKTGVLIAIFGFFAMIYGDILLPVFFASTLLWPISSLRSVRILGKISTFFEHGCNFFVTIAAFRGMFKHHGINFQRDTVH